MRSAHADRSRDPIAGEDRTGGRGKAATHARVLLVDDDEDVREGLAALLHEDGFAVSTAPGGEAALVQATHALPDVVLTDLQMLPIDGVELCRRLHQIDHDLPVIVMTGSSDERSMSESLRMGAEDYLIKPLQYEAVLRCVDRAIVRRAAKLEKEALHRTLNERLVLSSIREQEHAEGEAQQRAQLNTLLENLKEGVVIANPSGRVLMTNDAGRAILGFGDEDLSSVTALNSVEAHDLEGRPLGREAHPLMRALRGEQFVDYEVLRIRPNGERRRVVSTGTSVRDDSGHVALAIVVFRDVTELRLLEQQRDEYVALISHDLRSPLNGVLIFVEGMKRSMEQKGLAVNLADRAARNVMRMKAMLEELTEAATLESHGVALKRVACDLRELVAGVVDSMGDAGARRITIDADDGSPYVVLADASRLDRVLANLLTNALKYSAEDAPVCARFARRESEIDLEVIDRGIGIAPESVKMLFDRYYRTVGGEARAAGLGLGLYIARLIVEAHGGRIDVSSEVGNGSTFRVTLPSQTPA
jgi:two-component system, NtrC family, sensor histidine kinase KinB